MNAQEQHAALVADLDRLREGMGDVGRGCCAEIAYVLLAAIGEPEVRYSQALTKLVEPPTGFYAVLAQHRPGSDGCCNACWEYPDDATAWTACPEVARVAAVIEAAR